jgi:hypothetical protein
MIQIIIIIIIIIIYNHITNTSDVMEIMWKGIRIRVQLNLKSSS